MRKRYYTITRTRVFALAKKWRPTLNNYRGPVPAGLGIAHMLAESNGNEDPTLRNAQLRPVGLMQIPYREGRRLRYTEDALKDTSINIYVWCLLANEHARWLHENNSDWTQPDVDFWVAVRAIFILGRTNFDNLYNSAKSARHTKMTGVAQWVRTEMTATQRFNGLSRVDLRRIVDHLEEVRATIKDLDGPEWVSARFSEGPTVAPGNEFARHKTVAAVEVS